MPALTGPHVVVIYRSTKGLIPLTLSLSRKGRGDAVATGTPCSLSPLWERAGVRGEVKREVGPIEYQRSSRSFPPAASGRFCGVPACLPGFRRSSPGFRKQAAQALQILFESIAERGLFGSWILNCS